ncbi:hypothetical protein EYF80_063979 [Liparis tanakae]|uniref:Uncharacterized protein n=1 Tax=Liparis tanakae TaxID=230148 RepID=A0A4Z2EAW2_9TELE|nr:hypothetical protein EYF80_063979 [Liparis tanakae]
MRRREERRGEERFGLMPGELEHAGGQQEQEEEERVELWPATQRKRQALPERGNTEVGGQKRRGSKR